MDILLRVKEGKRALPYNDGTGPKLLQPGDTFMGPERFLDEFKDHVEAADGSGDATGGTLTIDATDEALQRQIREARPHEQVTYLQERAKRLRAEADRCDQQAGEAQQKAEAEAAELQKRLQARQQAEDAAQNASQAAPAPAGASQPGEAAAHAGPEASHPAEGAPATARPRVVRQAQPPTVEVERKGE